MTSLLMEGKLVFHLVGSRAVSVLPRTYHTVTMNADLENFEKLSKALARASEIPHFPMTARVHHFRGK